MRLGSLCTGYGGLELAVEAILGTRTVWLAEVDKHAAKVCAARFPGVPNLGDLTAVDWTQVEPVDVLTAGYPCQPFSHAGNRKGSKDARHLWPHIRDAVRVLRPRLVVLENVAGHLTLGFDAVLGDLASLGFDAEWLVVRASDVGACHQRARLFVVAADADSGRRGVGGERHSRPTGPRLEASCGDDADRLVAATAIPDRPVGGREGAGGRPSEVPGAEVPERPAVEPRRHGRGGRPAGAVATASDPSPVAWGDYAAAIDRHARTVGRPAPRPVDERGRLAPMFVEWMMMLPKGWVTDLLPRTQALKALGNGVVPPQAAYALRLLLGRLEQERAA